MNEIHRPFIADERLLPLTLRRRVAAALGGLVIIGALAFLPDPSHAQTRVRDVDNPARQPFQAELRRELTIPVPAGRENIQVADVPLGKRLVVEHVSLRIGSKEAVVPGSHQPRFQILASLITKAEAVAVNHELLVARADMGVVSANTASQPIRAYADGGAPVFLSIGGATEEDRRTSVSITMTISGHLIDLP